MKPIRIPSRVMGSLSAIIDRDVREDEDYTEEEKQALRDLSSALMDLSTGGVIVIQEV